MTQHTLAACVAQTDGETTAHVSKKRRFSTHTIAETPLAASDVSAEENGAPATPTLFRFWHDEKRFKGTGESSLVQRALLAAGGLRVGGNIKSAPTLGPMGYQRVRSWDLLWSPSSTALKAASAVKPGQLTSAVPGTASITKKRRLPATLHQAFGDDAWSILPRSFSLPTQVQAWRSWMDAQDPPGRWILKTAQHLAKGIVITEAGSALSTVVKRSKECVSAKSQLPKSKDAPKPFVVAQQYVDDPLLINGRKFGIRVWVLVSAADPLRLYLHQNGLVLFSNNEYDATSVSGPGGAPCLGHITNYAMNTHGDVWNLAMLRKHMGEDAFRKMYKQILRSTAYVYAAAYGSIRAECASARVPAGSAFELMGLDFLVDQSFQPWLLEVNATPSLAVEHNDPDTEQLIFREKNGMVQDMVSLMRVKERFRPRTPAPESAHSGPAPAEDPATVRLKNIILSEYEEAFYNPEVLALLLDLEAELQCHGSFMPLMALLPTDSAKHGWDMKWSAADRLVKSWCKRRRELMGEEPQGFSGGGSE